MRTVYKVLAYLVAVEVAVQAMVMVFAVAGLGKWVDGGGVFDKAVFESEQSPFPEVVGFIVHGINGSMVIPGGVKWAGLVLLLVAVQITLGFDIEVDQAVAGDLLEHVVEKTDTGGQAVVAAAIQIQLDADLCFQGVARNFGLAHGESRKNGRKFAPYAKMGEKTMARR